jgi:hypothetical protein
MGGQGGKGSGAIRAAYVTEDPSYRIDNASPSGTYAGKMFLYVIPMMPPQIIEVFHAALPGLLQFPTPVTQVKPAKVGGTLILYATGLGPVRDQSGNAVPIGQPFPENTTVISQVTVTIDNTLVPIAPQNAQGVPGFSNGYSVEFTLPDVSSLPFPETISIQISSAWIQSAVATFYATGGPPVAQQ